MMQMNLIGHLSVVVVNRIEGETIPLKHQNPAIDENAGEPSSAFGGGTA